MEKRANEFNLRKNDKIFPEKGDVIIDNEKRYIWTGNSKIRYSSKTGLTNDFSTPDEFPPFYWENIFVNKINVYLNIEKFIDQIYNNIIVKHNKIKSSFVYDNVTFHLERTSYESNRNSAIFFFLYSIDNSHMKSTYTYEENKYFLETTCHNITKPKFIAIIIKTFLKDRLTILYDICKESEKDKINQMIDYLKNWNYSNSIIFTNSTIEGLENKYIRKGLLSHINSTIEKLRRKS